MMKKENVVDVLRLKNREIRNEREKVQAGQITNTIISAYLSLLVERVGTFRVQKKEVSRALGQFVTTAVADGDDYVITVKQLTDIGECGGNI